jgi:hypothetical protein
MIFIAGLKVRATITGTGTFHCPKERGDRRYRRLRARRWVTLFFIPVMPLDQRGEWVECLGCGSSYRVDVLDRHSAHRSGGRD